MAISTTTTNMFDSKTSSATSSTIGSPIASTTSKVSVPPGLATLAGPSSKKILYDGLSSEDKARVSVTHAFAQSAHKLLGTYSVKRIIGFGSNGVVLAATLNQTPVAIKIIYKNKVSEFSPVPSEIEVLKHLNLSVSASTNSKLLRIIEDWQDFHHFYAVTDLFGSDWLASIPSTAEEQLRPLNFRANYNNANFTINLPFSAGSSDLWAWSYAHRHHVYSTEGHSMLPLQPVKQIVKQIATALSEMHEKGFYHGDVKIENILVQSGGALGPQVRLADFGHAKHASSGIKSYGTQEVAPPEFLADSPYSTQEIDGRAADVFALGMVLYLLLGDNGELPSMVRKVKAGRVGFEKLVTRQNGFYPLDEISDLDADAWQLLFAMTRVDPMTRKTIDQVLSHPFLADVV